MKSTEARSYLPEVSPEMAVLIASGEFKGNMGDLADGKYTSDFAAKIKSLSRVERTARPLEIPQILRDLPGDSEVIVRYGWGDSVQSVWLTLSMIEDQMERQARGRYELNEVAEILASMSKDANGLDAKIDGIAQGMKHAFEKGLLRFFDANGLWIDPENKDEDFLLYLGWYGDYTTPQAVNSWLESTGSPHRFPESAPAVPPDTVLMQPQAAPDDGTRPVQRQHAQEQAIMRLIREAGHDPLQLPMNEPGKPGIKSHVRKLVMRDPIFTGAKVFDKAWERLRSREEIADQH